MIRHFLDYYWKRGIPRGKTPCKDISQTPLSYKIVIDPYYKRISLESFRYGLFYQTLYDSYLLDFRHLRPNEQNAWRKIPLEESENQAKSLLTNQDDRAILYETYFFIDHLCRECQIQSIHQIPVATQKMFYAHLGDSFNGVILYDLQHRPVMFKKYGQTEDGKGFGELISEEWDMTHFEEGELVKIGEENQNFLPL